MDESIKALLFWQVMISCPGCCKTFDLNSFNLDRKYDQYSCYINGYYSNLIFKPDGMKGEAVECPHCKKKFKIELEGITNE